MEKSHKEYSFKLTLEASNCQLELITSQVFLKCPESVLVATWKQIRKETELGSCLQVRVKTHI